MISDFAIEIEEMINHYCKYDCDMRDYCSGHDCPINIENYQDYLYPDEEIRSFEELWGEFLEMR